ncbi:MAG: DsrE family protein [Gammaproteobacteria bacterium]|nr:DsrE family protein [Gammaproteobacteria bacterium]MDH5731329.1 DsrE family protein [Gammaproteobacteria bacterium]
MWNVKVNSVSFLVLGLLACLLVAMSLNTQASTFEAKHKIVIQVSTDDPKVQTIALNNAANLQKEYGMDQIEIEIVGYGPGLGLLTQNNANSTRVKSLAAQDIRFSACGNTMDKVTRKTGKRPELTEGVKTVKAGVGRIMELQAAGYAYIRP